MKRKTGIDLVKFIAIISVICVHFFYNTKFYTVPLTGNNVHLQVFIRWIFIICVPLFIIVTGYLQSEKEPEKKYFKKIVPIIVIYLIYSVLSILYRVYFLHETATVKQWISGIMRYNVDGYSWYVNMYIGLFLLSPYLNLIYKNLKSRKDKTILLFVLVLITGLPDLMSSLSGGISYFNILNTTDWWMLTLYPITYYFIGLYIKEYQIKINRLLLFALMIIVVLTETILTVLLSNGGKFMDIIGGYPSVIVMLQAVLLFLALYNVNIKYKILYKPIGFIAALTLDIYLASFISDKIVYGYFYKFYAVSQQEALVYFPVLTASTFVIALTIAAVRKYTIRIR